VAGQPGQIGPAVCVACAVSACGFSLTSCLAMGWAYPFIRIQRGCPYDFLTFYSIDTIPFIFVFCAPFFKDCTFVFYI
jgi:hypothetical protein